MRLKELFKNSGVKLTGKWNEIVIADLQYDSRKVKQGDLFIAVKGYETDGHKFLAAAYEQGAAAAVVEKQNKAINIPQIVVENSRTIMAQLAYSRYQKALEEMSLVGITGTNGKTTCSYLVRSVMQHAGISTGLAGTIHYIIGEKRVDAWNTTPEAIDLYKMLNQMHQAGNRACALEVSSHALALNRVAGLKFKAAVFTNLSRDHMDFHADMESYFAEKLKLFHGLDETGIVVTNMDDSYGQKVSSDKAGHIRYAINKQADVKVIQKKISIKGIELRVEIAGKPYTVNSRMIGDFNIYNIITAIATGVGLGLPVDVVIAGVEAVHSVPGRLETYPLSSGALAIVDYAHTPDALEKALLTTRRVTENKLRVVFGCGGDRDAGKRPLMGQAAEQNADFCYVTDDNPRTENPQNIINDILKGMQKNEKYRVINNREQAITQAVKDARKGDIVLIAGKGHESYQIIGKTKFEFNEPAIIESADRDA